MNDSLNTGHGVPGIGTSTITMDLGRLSSLNCNGLGNNRKRKDILHGLKEASIIFLQETHTNTEILEKWQAENQNTFQLFANHGTTQSGGTLIAIKRSLITNVQQIDNHDSIDDKGRITSVIADFSNNKLALISIYAPNLSNEPSSKAEYRAFLSNLEAILTKCRSLADHLVVAGDLNLFLNPTLDAQGGRMTYHKDIATEVTNTFLNFNLFDPHRALYPDKKMFTFHRNYKTFTLHRRLDYIYISDSLVQASLRPSIHPSPFTDHDEVRLIIDSFQQSNRKRATYWRFNSQLMSNNNFVDAFAESFVAWKQESFSLSPPERWEFLKYRTRQLAIACSKEKAKEESKHKNEAMLELNQSYAEMISNPDSVNALQEYQTCLRKYESVQDKEVERLAFQAQAKYYEQGEKMSKYFFLLINRKTDYQRFKALKMDDGDITTDEREMDKIITKHFQITFTNSNSAKLLSPLSTLFKEKLFRHIKTIPQEDITKLNKPITKGEVTKTVCQKLATGKAPGVDGLNMEFYKGMWKHIADDVYDSLTEGISRQLLQPSQRASSVKLLPKKGKDLQDIASWRPISLMATDKKILSRLLTARMKSVMNKLIEPSQLAYIQGRNIQDGAKLIHYILEHCNNTGQKGVILTVDIKSAFDMVSHAFLWEALERYGFPDYFLRVAKTMYNQAEAKIQCNNHIAGTVDISKGILQGCSFSCQAFILVMNTLITLLQNNTNVQFLNIDGKAYKTTAYADDLTIFLQDLDSIKEIIEIFKDFQTVTGLGISLQKSEVMLVGKWQRVTPNEVNGIKVVDQMKVTGMIFHKNPYQMERLNYEPVIQKITRKINELKLRHVSIFGRAMIINAQLLSYCQFPFSLLPPSEYTLKRISKLIYGYLWNGTDKVTRALTMQKILDGGLNVISPQIIAQAANAKWITVGLHGEKEKPWIRFLMKDLERIRGRETIYGTVTKEALANFNYNINRQSLSDFSSIFSNPKPNTEEAKLTRLWENPIFNYKKRRIKDAIVRIPALDNAGIKTIGDLFYEDGTIVGFNEAKELGLSGVNWIQWISLFKKIGESNIKTMKEKGGLVPISFKDPAERKMFYELEKEDPFIWPSNRTEHPLNNKLIFEAKDNPIFLNPEECTQKQLKHLIIQKLEISIPPFQKSLIQEHNVSSEHLMLTLRAALASTISARQRSFIWRLRNGLVYGNDRLFHFKVKDSQKCDLCSEVKQTSIHRLFECPGLSGYWQYFHNHFRKLLPPNLTSVDLLLGLPIDSQTTKLKRVAQNHVIFTAVRYLHDMLTQQAKPSITGLVQNLKHIKQMEYHIALNNHKLELHFQKYDILNPYFE